MFFATDQLSLIVCLSIGLVLSGALALWKPRRSLVDVAMGASALAAIAYLMFATVRLGPPPLFVIGLGGAFLMYLPLSFLTGLACRLALRQRLRLFHGALGIDEPRARKVRQSEDSHP